MNEITLSAWDTVIRQRDLTILALFFFAATGLMVWRLWLKWLPQRLTAALATITYVSLLVIGVVELWRL